MKKMTIDECARYLTGHDGFLIISHVRPDGDTLGSGAALCSALRRAGKTAYCYNNPGLTETYRAFVSPWFGPDGFKPACTVTVDVADVQLIPEGIKGPVDLLIDHHPSNTYYSENCLVDGTKSSCGEVILEVIKALGNGLTKQEADLLYIAVSTDTGCFMYSNTNAATFRAAAEMLDFGADNKDLNTVLFRTMSHARLALEGMMLSNMRYFRDGRISAAVVTLDMMEKSGATENDCEDIAGLAGKAEGSLMSITIRELEPGKCKVSLRSHPQVNCSDICAVFGGGGHRMAAGCNIDLPPDDALRVLLEAIDEKWPES